MVKILIIDNGKVEEFETDEYIILHRGYMTREIIVKAGCTGNMIAQCAEHSEKIFRSLGVKYENI